MARLLSSDPYKSYRFQVKFDNVAVAGVNNVSSLSKNTESISFRPGGANPTSFSMPGLTSFDPVTLSGGLTKHKDFHNWARAVDPNVGYEQSKSEERVRKDITIELHDDNGQAKVSYKVLNCWVSEYQAFPELNSGGNEIAIQTITLQHEGFVKQ